MKIFRTEDQRDAMLNEPDLTQVAILQSYNEALHLLVGVIPLQCNICLTSPPAHLHSHYTIQLHYENLDLDLGCDAIRFPVSPG